MGRSPILDNKYPDEPSVFVPDALLREARRQKGLAAASVPEVCILDPDGDMARRLRSTGQSAPFAAWACYHTELDVFTLGGREVGILGRAVGSSFAVLVAEQLFASGCRLLLSMTSSGQIAASGPTPYFILIERALRDEGTSYHYAAPSQFAEADPALLKAGASALESSSRRVFVGATWTTDAPYRETQQAIDAARSLGILAVEMEASALYAFARASRNSILCLAHVTNTMGQAGDDFEKGEADGTTDALDVLSYLVGITPVPKPTSS
ncbi:MAG: nucleoside phosphorylase [Pseudolabrys sp.]|nr:nucleoside phosphorylase [Pseudolabrys sp.]